ALLSKSVTATLPAALVVLLWWRRGRIDPARDLRPLVPFVALAIVAGALTSWFERTLIGPTGADFDVTIIQPTVIAGRALWFYATTLAWPLDLAFIYPRWNVNQSVWWQYLFPIAALAVAVVAWRLRRRTRAPFAALAIFAVTLAPALGFVNVYPF